MTHTLIIGGGAAGMIAAVTAARAGEAVTVWERGRKPLKKLGVTGNGRGNLLNRGEPVFYGNTAFAREVLSHAPYEACAAFWQGIGVPLTEEDEGRMYPASFLASTAVDALRRAADRAGVRIVPCTRAADITPENGGFTVHGIRAVYAPDTTLRSGREKPGALVTEEPASLRADRVIVACGGAAAPMHGTDGSGYALLTGLGHALIPPHPALCALVTEEAPLRGLTGQRVRSALTLESADGRTLARSRGEALFAQDGVSGIAAMQLSRFAEDGCVLRMDLRAAVTGSPDTDIHAWLTRRAESETDASQLLTGAATRELSDALWRMAGTSPALNALDALGDAITRFTVRVRGTRGLENAQVTAGGINPDAFDPADMQSRLVPGLYAAGEVLDVDGGCGGFNLLFAAASGLLSGSRGKLAMPNCPFFGPKP